MASFESSGEREATTGSLETLQGKDPKRNREWMDGFSKVAQGALKESGADEKGSGVRRCIEALGLASALAVGGCASVGEGMKVAGVQSVNAGRVVEGLVLGVYSGREILYTKSATMRENLLTQVL